MSAYLGVLASFCFLSFATLFLFSYQDVWALLVSSIFLAYLSYRYAEKQYFSKFFHPERSGNLELPGDTITMPVRFEDKIIFCGEARIWVYDLSSFSVDEITLPSKIRLMPPVCHKLGIVLWLQSTVVFVKWDYSVKEILSVSGKSLSLCGFADSSLFLGCSDGGVFRFDENGTLQEEARMPSVPFSFDESGNWIFDNAGFGCNTHTMEVQNISSGKEIMGAGCFNGSFFYHGFKSLYFKDSASSLLIHKDFLPPFTRDGNLYFTERTKDFKVWKANESSAQTIVRFESSPLSFHLFSSCLFQYFEYRGGKTCLFFYDFEKMGNHCYEIEGEIEILGLWEHGCSYSVRKQKGFYVWDYRQNPTPVYHETVTPLQVLRLENGTLVQRLKSGWNEVSSEGKENVLLPEELESHMRNLEYQMLGLFPLES